MVLTQINISLTVITLVILIARLVVALFELSSSSTKFSDKLLPARTQHELLNISKDTVVDR